MHAIIVISSDTRIPAVKESLQPSTGGKLRIAADFDRGLKEIFDKRPPLVFIQDDIGGVSGETVARHIKALLQDNCPKIVLLSRQPGKQQGKWFDEVIDLSLAEKELVDAFLKQL